MPPETREHVQGVADQMGASYEEALVLLHCQAQGLRYDRGLEERFEDTVLGKTYGVDLSRPVLGSAGDFWRMVFESAEEARQFLCRHELLQAVEDPRQPGVLVLPGDSETTYTAQHGDSVVFTSEGIRLFMLTLFKRQQILAKVSIDDLLVHEREERARFLEEFTEGILDAEEVRRYLVVEEADVQAITNHSWIRSEVFDCLPKPARTVEDEEEREAMDRRYNELFRFNIRLKGAEHAIYGQGDGLEYHEVFSTHSWRSQVSKLRMKAVAFQHLTGLNPIPIMKGFFIKKLMESCRDYGIPIPMSYARYLTDDVRRIDGVVLDFDAFVEGIASDMVEGFVEVAEAHEVAHVAEELMELSEQGLDERMAVRAVETQMDRTTQRMVAWHEILHQDVLAGALRFMELYPDPTVIIDEIMGTVDGELPITF